MRLSLNTDYALRILIYLATDETRLHGVAEVSAAFGMPNSTVMKITSDLVRLGFVESLRGRAGGIRLAHPAQEMNLGKIVAVVENSLTLAECAGCMLEPRCRLKGIFREAVGAFIAVLERYHLSDLVANGPELLPLFHTAAGAEGCASHIPKL